MEIVVNGIRLMVEAKDLSDAIEELGYECKKVVVALNNTFIAKEKWSDVRIESGDHLEVLAAIEGG